MEYLHEPFQNAQPMRRNVLNYSNHIDDALHAVLAKQEKDYDIPKGKSSILHLCVASCGSIYGGTTTNILHHHSAKKY